MGYEITKNQTSKEVFALMVYQAVTANVWVIIYIDCII